MEQLNNNVNNKRDIEMKSIFLYIQIPLHVTLAPYWMYLIRVAEQIERQTIINKATFIIYKSVLCVPLLCGDGFFVGPFYLLTKKCNAALLFSLN